MDIFSCESQMIAASYSDENTYRGPIPSPTTFGLDVGPSGPNNNEFDPQLGFPDTNIYLLFYVSKLITLFRI